MEDMLGPQQVIGRLRHAATQMGVKSLREGSWFRSILAAHVRSYSETISANRWEALYPGLDRDERARREIERTARKAVATGMAAASGTSAAELLVVVTEGLATPVGVPFAMASMVLETVYTAFLQIKLACDLASIYGAPFDPNDAGDVAVLFGLALDVEAKNEVANQIGRKLLEEAALKTSIPVLGVALTGKWNYVATCKLAAIVQRYVRYRAALREAVADLRMESAPNAAFIIAGAWLLATADGQATHEEVRALTSVIGALPRRERGPLHLEKLLHSNEGQWFDDLAGISGETEAPLLDVLYLVAATDQQLHETAQRFLCRVGAVLATEIDFNRIARLSGQLARGGRPPEVPVRAPA
jgi:uncharacterized protein (DUF697 family)